MSSNFFGSDPQLQSKKAVERIGVFDSGVGGLSVLRALRIRLPAASFIYIADAAYAPYGDRSAATVIERCERMVETLVRAGVGMVVVACNTGSVLAIARLRERWPGLPFVGVEPGIKPAVAATRSGRIAVLATRATVNSRRLMELIDRHAAGVFVHLQAGPGLVEAIEAGDLNEPSFERALEDACAPIRKARVDTVVLGCTHYPLIATQIACALGPEVLLIDTAAAVGERVASLWPQQGARDQASTSLLTTGRCDVVVRVLRALRALEWAPGAKVAQIEIQSTPRDRLVPGTGVEPVRSLSRSGGF